MGPENSIEARFLELLVQHPELTRPQAYIQAVMEVMDSIIENYVADGDKKAKQETAEV